ncbi:glucuronyl hydrolase [Pseudomonas sp. K13]|nr:glucuronyl hydrolase [Pseudomonas sp. K13]MDO7903250.1 glucuronyl hydrolase [Pseudomonas sp. K13]
MPEQRKRQAVIEALLAPLGRVSQQCDGQFPLYRLAPDTPWKLSRRGSWLGGFWAALWWRRAGLSGQATDLAEAQAWSERLHGQLAEPSLNRSFVFWYGAGLAARHPDGAQARQLAERAAAALAADFDPGLGGWWLGTGLGAGEPGAATLDVDALAPTLALLHSSPVASHADLARRHLQRCLHSLAEPSGAWAAQAVRHADGHWQRSAPGHWARGQAWAMLGLAEAVGRYGGEYAEAAARACEYWTQRWGAQAAAGRLRANEADPCAIAIASLALLRLWQCLPGRNAWCELACRQIGGLLSPEVKRGRFVGHSYRIGPQQTHLVETPCATFFLIEALRAQGQVLAGDGGVAGW